MNVEKRGASVAIGGNSRLKYKTDNKKEDDGFSEEPIDPDVYVLYKKRRRKRKIIAAVSILGAAGVLLSGGYLYYLNTPDQIIARSSSRAKSFVAVRNYGGAITELKKILELDNKNIQAYLEISQAYVGLNETDNALQCLQTGIDETGDEELKAKLKELKATPLLDNANRLFSQEKYDEARKEFKNVLVIDDENVEAYFGMANSLLAMENGEGALEILTAGLEKTKDKQIEAKLNELQVLVYLRSAEQYLADEEYKSALEELKKAIEINDKCVRAYLTYADVCGETERINEAVEILQAGFDKTSDEQIEAKLNEYKVLQRLNNAENYLYDEEYEKAKTEYEKALELDEGCARAYLGLADYYGRMGQQERAIDILKKGYEITEDEDISDCLDQILRSTMLWQASSYYNEGDFLNAIDEYFNVLDIDPYCVDAYLGIANAYVRLNRNDDAIDILQTGYSYTWNNTILSKLTYLKKDPHLNLANKYLSGRDYSKAAEEFRTVLSIDYYCVEAYIGLAEAYVGLGRLSWADETLVEGYDATGSWEIEVKMFEVRLDHASLSPQTTSYGPLNSTVKQILSKITTSGMSTYQRVKACYDYLIDNGRYGHASDSYFDAGDMADERKYAEKSAYAFLKDGVGNCLNYNAAFTAMTRAIGLKTILRTGETLAYGGGYTSHTWCEIELNGTVYVFDPQLEDNYAGGAPTPYLFFCQTYDKVQYTHYAEGYYSMF